MKKPPTDLSQYFSKLGRLGGRARSKALTPARRQEIARKANQASAAKRSKRGAK